MHFHQTKCLVFLKFENISHWKIVSVPLFLFLFTTHFFDFQKFVLSSISNYCINVVRLVLSWSSWYSIKRSTLTTCNFNSSWLLYLSFSNITNIWNMKNWKSQQFFFEIKEQPKSTINVISFFCIRKPYWYGCWRVLRDFCRLSKKFSFAFFPKM